MDERTGEWWLDHPVTAIALFAGPAIAGGLAGVLMAWLLTARHLLSPDNVLAGTALGVGGAIAGLIAGALAVWLMNAARS